MKRARKNSVTLAKSIVSLSHAPAGHPRDTRGTTGQGTRDKGQGTRDGEMVDRWFEKSTVLLLLLFRAARLRADLNVDGRLDSSLGSLLVIVLKVP